MTPRAQNAIFRPRLILKRFAPVTHYPNIRRSKVNSPKFSETSVSSDCTGVLALRSWLLLLPIPVRLRAPKESKGGHHVRSDQVQTCQECAHKDEGREVNWSGRSKRKDGSDDLSQTRIGGRLSEHCPASVVAGEGEKTPQP